MSLFGLLPVVAGFAPGSAHFARPALAATRSGPAVAMQLPMETLAALPTTTVLTDATLFLASSTGALLFVFAVVAAVVVNFGIRK
jgi:hypothetical protein